MSVSSIFLRCAVFATLMAAPAGAQQADLERYAGYYRDGQETYRISHKDGRLYSQGPGQPEIEVKRSGPDRFVGPHFAYAFVSNRAGRITGLRFDLHGEETLWPRLSDREARVIAAREAANLARRTPHPGVEAILRRHILAVEQGAPLYDEMGPALARGVRGAFPQVQKMLAGLGRFQALTWKSTLASGADAFSAQYEKGKLEWVIAPPRKDGRVHNLAFKME